MSDPGRAEEDPSAEWARVLDRLIGWAVARADAAVEEICGYLDQRAAAVRGPDWARSYLRSSLPYRGRGRDHSCASLRRRLRSGQNGTLRPRGVGRPPRRRRLPG